jgi:hypothetical protein
LFKFTLNYLEIRHKTITTMKKQFLIIVCFCITMLLQAQVSKTVNVTSGGLSSALTETEKNTITNLTLTGEIDARDFKTMRDDMPVLAVVDISGVTIVAYTGTEGTAGASSIIYAANAIPQFAFYTPGIGKSITSLTAISIPTTVLSIGVSAFQYCNGLTSFTFPSSVISIELSAFEYCSGFSSITIPSTLSSIGDKVFAGCSALITVDPVNANYSSVDGILFNKAKTTLIQYPTSKRGSYTIPSSVTSVALYAFFLCNSLNSISIPSSVTSIGGYAFRGCSSLTSLTIPSSVTTIANGTFFGCTGLISITIPSSVTSIGGWAFSECIGLASIYACSVTPPNLSSSTDVFLNINKTTCILYVPIGSKAAYQLSLIWQDFVNIIEFDASTTAIKLINSEIISLYPNPVSDGFHVNGLKKTSTLSVFDINGRLLLSKRIVDNEYISVNFLPKGVYMVRISSESGISEKKLVRK